MTNLANKIKAILNYNGVRCEIDQVGNVWTYHGPQVWVSSVAQANRIVEGGLYN